METNSTCLVLDLDDTLYKEYDYQTSGLKYVEKMISSLYSIDFTGKLLDLRARGVRDVFLETANLLAMPMVVKESFLMMYRCHKPDISLSPETEVFLESAFRDFKQVAILTDGRSITQRLKLASLGLTGIPVYISEEWKSTKPGSKRFVQIMEDFPSCNNFCYLADNVSKDFVAPNTLGWITVCIKGNEKNIYSQDIVGINKKYLPNFFVNRLDEIYKC